MESTDINVLRQQLHDSRQENTFLRIALAHAIGDGTLTLGDISEQPPRFLLQTSGEKLHISLAESDLPSTALSE